MEILDKIQRNKIENFIGKFSRWVHENIKTDSGIHFTINIKPESTFSPTNVPHLIVTALIPIDGYSRFYRLHPQDDMRAKYPSGFRPHVIFIDYLTSTDNPVSFSSAATMGFYELCRMIGASDTLSKILWEN